MGFSHRATWFFVYSALLIPAGAFADWEALRVTVSKDLFQTGINAPITQSKSISEIVSGTAISGTALTTASIGVDFFPSNDFAGIMLRVDSQTNSSTIGVNNPRVDIAVNIWASTYTQMTSWKPIFFTTNRIATNSATSNAQTTLTYQGLDVTASGFLWRLKERVAEKKAWEQAYAQKPNNEQRISRQAAAEMNKMLDTKADPLMEPLNRLYYSSFYKPFFIEKRIPGNLHFSSTSSSLSASVTLPEMPASLTLVSGLVAPLSIQVHQEMLSLLATHSLAGKTLNESDLEELLIFAGLPAGIGNYGKDEAQVSLHFCEKSPLQVILEEGKATLNFCVQEATFKTIRQSQCQLQTVYQSTLSTAGGLVLGRVSAPKLACPKEFAAAMEAQKRFERIFPPSLEYEPMVMPAKGGSGGVLRVLSASLSDGWATVSWWMDRNSN